MLGRSTDRPTGGVRTTSAVHRAVAWFIGWSLFALAGLAVVALVIANEVAKDSAVREASLRTRMFGRNVASPLVNAAVRSGRPQDLRLLGDVLRNRLRDGSVVHIKIWDKDGRVLWADEAGLIGRQFSMTPDVQELFGTEGVVAEFSDLTQSENVLEHGEGPLLEVYAGTYDAEGLPFVFESYWATDHIQDDQRALEKRLEPLVLGALVLFELAILPLAISLARRVDRIQAERTAMQLRALDATDRERRRIAQDLHDGLLQDLAGLGYALPAVGAQLPPEAHEARRVLVDAAAVVERDVIALRSLLTDVYPADLTTGGLADAVAALARQAGQAGLVVDTHLEGLSEDSPPHVAQLCYRIIREGLRNVVKHAEATHTEVRAGVESGIVTVSVLDDGRGPSRFSSEPGHLGLRLLEDTVGDVGGQVALKRRESGGSALTATFPWGINGHRDI
jgi:signal transduction histidine kinase